MTIPEGLEKRLTGLAATEEQKTLASKLCELDQEHLFADWSEEGQESSSQNKLLEQLVSLDKAYPGGLETYLTNAKRLLANSRQGVNPLEGWTPSVPAGELFELGTPEYDETEALGMPELGSVGFALVAGGLGERLGYSNIKIGLPTEMASETCYLAYYVEYILAVQKRFGKGKKLPLCIMTSNDTNAGTVKLLKDNKYFGLEPSQVTLVQQGDGVPALTDNDARIALDPDNKYRVSTKPHGHGDIHALIYSHQVAKKWLDMGIEWLCLFQDTNGLAFHPLPLMLGVSKKLNLIMNSLAVPRKAKQAIGGIAKLENVETKETRTINVEYNQLDPLLRATGHDDGDVNDEKTGFSPFPGNINQLLFSLKPYHQILERTKGIMPEFVNPKYKDAEKTQFKKPTRLECMMQDFPTVLQDDETARVGFTSIAAELCFSPVKNATADGVKLQEKGTAPGVAMTGEADQYHACRLMMTEVAKCNGLERGEPETRKGITAVLNPAIVLKPSFVVCAADYKTKFPSPDKIKITANSTLIVRGSGVVIESLDLDGSLIIDFEEGHEATIRDLVVRNKGWSRVEVADDEKNEVWRMRGYRVERHETRDIKNGPCVIL